MHSTHPRLGPADGPADLLMAAARGLRRRYLAAIASFEVTPGQARALRSICVAGPVRLSALANLLDIAPRSATEVVDALQARGLVLREPDPADRRATCVVATAEGSRVLGQIEEVRTEEFERYLAVLPERDQADLSRILAALLAASGRVWSD